MCQKGAAFMLMHRLRECMWEDEPGRFTGETEIDEMLLHLECGKRVSLMVAYNRPTRRIRFKIVERRSKKKPKANKREMLKFICEVTVPGSTILSDGDAAMPTPEQMRRTRGVICHNSRKGSRKGSQGRKFLTYMLLHGELPSTQRSQRTGSKRKIRLCVVPSVSATASPGIISTVT